MNTTPKAIALISGGLDSMLAAKVVMDQGVHVEGINFYTGFCVEGHTHAIRDRDRQRPKRNNALWVAEQLGIKLHIIDVIEEYKQVVINPKHGYGTHMNPCLDCKGFMVKKAHQWMQENSFDFIITGEVLGQRPMSQRKQAMPIVARESGAGERLLRPLCAQLLPPTLAEQNGWVNREQLLGLNGRSRKPQIAMAEKYGYDDYSQPAGGCCFLTNEHYSSKLADLWQHRNSKDYELDDIMLLKVGRHLRPSPNFKLIIGRDEGENNYLEGYRRQFTHLRAITHTGPLALLDGKANMAELTLAAQVFARFSQGRDAASVGIEIIECNGSATRLDIAPIAVDAINQEWYV